MWCGRNAKGQQWSAAEPPLTHPVCGLDVGTLLRQVPDGIHIATLSSTMERRLSALCTSKSGGANYTKCCTGVLRTPSAAWMLAPFSARYRTASTLHEAARMSGVQPPCAQASQERGKRTTSKVVFTHDVRGLDVGTLLHKVLDGINFA